MFRPEGNGLAVGTWRHRTFEQAGNRVHEVYEGSRAEISGTDSGPADRDVPRVHRYIV
jgi:hypothetical protein